MFMFAKFIQDRFKVFLSLAAVIIIAAGLVWFNSGGRWPQLGGGASTIKENLLPKVSVNLTSEQQIKFEEAVKKYQDQIARGDSQGERTMLRPYLYLGINYESLGELELARRAYLKAAEVNQASDIPWSNLGSLYQQMGSLRLGKEALLTAVRLNPQNSLVWQKLIELYFKMNETEGNIEALYQKAITSTDSNIELVRDYALYLEQLGRHNDAIKQWQIILAKTKEKPQLDGIKDKINELQAKSK